MSAAGWAAVSYLVFCTGVAGLFWALLRSAPDEPPPDPMIREDREVQALDAIWDLPAFDPHEFA